MTCDNPQCTARNHWDALLDEVERLRADRDKVREEGYWQGYGEGRDEAETRDLSFDAMTDRAEAAETAYRLMHRQFVAQQERVEDAEWWLRIERLSGASAQRRLGEAAVDCERLSTLGQEWQARALVAEAKVARVEVLAPSECWVTRSDVGLDCTAMIGGGFENGAKWTEEMCCLPCRLRQALEDAPEPTSAPETGQQASGGVLGRQGSACPCGHAWDMHGPEAPGCVECRCRETQ